MIVEALVAHWIPDNGSFIRAAASNAAQHQLKTSYKALEALARRVGSRTGCARCLMDHRLHGGMPGSRELQDLPF